MHAWQAASLAFFAYLSLVVVLRHRGMAGAAVRRIAIGIAAGVLLVLVSRIGGQPAFLQEWIWPPALLLAAYWTSGVLFQAPVPRQERALMWLDDRLRVPGAAALTPRAVAELLEAAYTGVYLLVPIALLLNQGYAPSPDPARFWTVILVTDFICFGVLPWVQTRPPRALESREPWTSSIRAWNLRLLGTTSIQANTFPSGHAAEAIAAALLAGDAPWPIVALMWLAAMAVSAGAVLGRYHYLADAIVGWAVAIVVFALLR
jgi:membrane-associated phospholipid phosphatase